MQTFLFYDIETTGLNKAFDQIVQFAAIRTDLALQEIERYEIHVTLNKDTIPSPYALITHHISIHNPHASTNEFQAMQAIHAILNTPGTISLGYNTLGFDDEFLRFSFYRNLLAPYTHQYANGCARLDLYPIAALYFLYKNSVIQWPEREGLPTLKLEYINQANSLAKGQAHNAMVDVEATLALAKKFYAEKEMWDYALGYFNKKRDKDRLALLPKDPHPEAIYIDGIMGAKQLYAGFAIYIGEHLHYTNQGLWLRLDKPELLTTTAETFTETTWVMRKKWGEPGMVLPPKERFLSPFSAERLDIIAANKQWISDNPKLMQDIVQYYQNYQYPECPEADAQSRLYLDGFKTSEEDTFCKRFLQPTCPNRAALTDALKDSSLKTLALRLLGRHFPESLLPHQQKEFEDYLQRIHTNQDMIDFRHEKRLTPHQARLDIAECRKRELSVQQQELLNELDQYLSLHFS